MKFWKGKTRDTDNRSKVARELEKGGGVTDYTGDKRELACPEIHRT